MISYLKIFVNEFVLNALFTESSLPLVIYLTDDDINIVFEISADFNKFVWR